VPHHTVLGSVPDLLRLLAVPVLGWAAWRDVKIRRVPNSVWVPLALVGLLALALEAHDLQGAGGYWQLYLLQIAVSLGIVAPFGYLFWWFGGFGGADAKALLVLTILFPTYPTFRLAVGTFPLEATPLGVFSLTILSNTVVMGIAYPLVLALRNALRGHVALAMFIGRPVEWAQIPEEHGRLLETPAGFSRQGLDLDALRMYLTWRGTTLDAIRETPEDFRDPATLPDEFDDPGDGRIVADGGHDGPTVADADAADAGVADENDFDDAWGAEQFLDSIEGSAYGTSPVELRDGLEVLVTEEDVWISPGIPFLVPMFFGLVASLTYGDLLFAVLGAVGLV
jgi:preflagellin peptidase FlaK